MGKFFAGGIFFIGLVLAMVGVWQVATEKVALEKASNLAAGLLIMVFTGLVWHVFAGGETDHECCACCTCDECLPELPG